MSQPKHGGIGGSAVHRSTYPCNGDPQRWDNDTYCTLHDVYGCRGMPCGQAQHPVTPKILGPSTLERRIWSLKLDGARWYKEADLIPTAQLAFAWWENAKVSASTLSEAAADWVLDGEKPESQARVARRFLREVALYLRTKRGAP